MVDSEAEAEVGDDEQAGTAGSGSDMVERETGGRKGGRQKENKNGGIRERRIGGSREIHLVGYGRGGEEEKKRSRSRSYLVQNSTRRAPL